MIAKTLPESPRDGQRPGWDTLAVETVRQMCDFVTAERGGHGAVRSFCEHVLKQNNVSGRSCICIPARLASTRLPSKLLLEIDGIAIVRRTCLQCQKTNIPIFVFTDSQEIASAVAGLATVVLTHEQYQNGTERLSRNEHKIPPEFDIIINVQGDEPFISPENIIHAIAMHEKRTPDTFYTTLHEMCDIEAAEDPARVKVAVSNNRAHWYSRSVIPYFREGSPTIKIFTGIYVFQREMLKEFAALPDTPCQLAESIEQLKVLEHGYHIASYPTTVRSAPSIDTIEDFEKASFGTTTRADRKQLLLDCTLRDGGYINNWMFDDGFVSDYLSTVADIVDIIEVGFVNLPESYRSCPVGKYRNLNRSHLSFLRKLCPGTLAVMVDLNAINREVLIPRNNDVDIVRIAFGKSDVARAKLLAQELLDLRYDVCMNFMSSHLYQPAELAAHAAEVSKAIPYVVDSLGCMSANDVDKYLKVLPQKCGMHLHNNLQQAAGTYKSVKPGIVDATIFGMGRGAGNLPLELCEIRMDQRVQLTKFYNAHMSNIPRSWGYAPEFVLQAFLNCHPNYVIKMMDMGIDTEYISRVLLRLQGETKFDLDKLHGLFSSLHV